MNGMAGYKFSIEIIVRYGDLDAQGHVNHSRFFTFMEQARMRYLHHLGLWDGVDFLSLGVIVADAHFSFRAPIKFGQLIRVGARIARIGNKSLLFEYSITDPETGFSFGNGETTMVTYDFHTEKSIPVPPDWREKIVRFEETVQTT